MIIKKVPVVFKTPVIETNPEPVQSCPHLHRTAVSPPVCLILPSSCRFDLPNGLSSPQNLLKWSVLTEFQRKFTEMGHEATNNICNTYKYIVFLRPVFSYWGISVLVSVRKLAMWRFGEFGTTLYSAKESGFPPIPNLLYVCPYLPQPTALRKFFVFTNFHSRNIVEYLTKRIGHLWSVCLDRTPPTQI